MSRAEITASGEILVLLLAFIVLPLVSALAGQRLAKTSPPSLLPRYVQTMLRGWVVAAIILGLWLWAHHPLRDLGLDMPVGPLGLVGFVLDGVLLLFYVRIQARMRYLGDAEIEALGARVTDLKLAPRTAAELAMFLLLAITAGVWEEILYRGFALWYLSPRLGLLAALIVSSLAFGAGHLYQGWRGFALTSLLGLAFALLYIGSRSLWWLMLAHALIDMQAGIASIRITRQLAKIRARAETTPLQVKVN